MDEEGFYNLIGKRIKFLRKMRNLLNIKIYNIHIFYCISLSYVIMWIIDNYNPHEIYKFFNSIDFFYNLKYLFIYFLGYMFFSCLPEIVIHIFDFAANKLAIENKIAVKIMKVLILIFGYIYFVLLCLLFIGARGLFME